MAPRVSSLYPHMRLESSRRRVRRETGGLPWARRDRAETVFPKSRWSAAEFDREQKAGRPSRSVGTHYPFNAPKVRPLVMYFSNAMPAATTGMTLTNEMALMFHHSV